MLLPEVMGDGFVARDITFRNTAGPDGGQAVALLSNSDRSAYYRCSFEGYQDTLWANSNRQFYRECHIYGTIDFIFGNAAAVIQDSFIYARAPRHGQEVVITAHARSEPNQPTGFSIINSKFQPDPAQKQALKQFKAYLGRPWQRYARTVYLKCFLDGMLDPIGWADWSFEGVDKTRTVFYAEFGNYGPGSSTNGRVKWRGFKAINDVHEVEGFSVGRFIDGEEWIPSTGVPFYGGIPNHMLY